MGRHKHLHLNVQRTMSRAHITADIEAALLHHGDVDTVGFCELETDFHHTEFNRLTKKHGFTGYLPPLGSRGSALGLAVRDTYGTIVYTGTTFCAPGASHVSPSRYINRFRVQRHADRKLVCVAETHQYSSGWTGTHSLDALRRLRWYLGMAVVRAVCRGATDHANEVVIGGGDLNRPPSSFPGGKPLAALLSTAGGMTTADYAHTDATHGSTTFDYVWVLSKRVAAKVTAWSTPDFHSDHDAIVALVDWPDAAPAAAE